ncbi:hypothetical protein ACWN8V_11080 [Vagococcus elongatus]|uniref:hypothetical protein n=1 Tax=Vagococcus elongatus TaxID=180344 RepID=UPI00147722B9|nr:hypothetical protein [Vagococcus elongatus]
MNFIKKYKLELALILVFFGVNIADYLFSYVTLKSVAMVGIVLLVIYVSLVKKFKPF